MKQWVLSKSSFDLFLAILDSNPNLAAQKYETLRIKLIKFFEWRACSFAEDLTDETLDRVVKKVEAGEQINDYTSYSYQVARFLYLEYLKKQAKRQAVVTNMTATVSVDEDDNPQLNCLESCLSNLSTDNRKIILGYYYNDKQAKIDRRKKLAETLGISANALRIKALRIRAKLEECVLKCLNNYEEAK